MEPILADSTTEDFLFDAKSAAWQVRNELADRTAKDIAMYLGFQHQVPVIENNRYTGRTQALPTLMDSDTKKLRATLNRINKHAQRIAASTRPDKIEFDAHPTDFGVGMGAMTTAQIIENTANLMMDMTGYVRCRRRANFLRTLTGTGGVALSLETGTRKMTMDGVEKNVPDAFIRAFTFLAHQLLLDPGVASPDLMDHEYVILEEIMTQSKMARVFQKRIPDDHLRFVAELTSFERCVYNLTGGKVFSQYKLHSRTRGARVYHIYRKDANGRFSDYKCAVELVENKLMIFGNESPWGGCQLPISIIIGHMDPESPFGSSDVSQMTPDQKWHNLYATFLLRSLKNFAHYKWLYDTRSVPGDSSHEQFLNRMTNEVGGAVPYNAGRREQGIDKPGIVTYPPPPPFVLEGMNQAETGMREQGHRSEGSYGQTKSHVPDATFQQALIEGDKVVSARVLDDIEQDVRMAEVMVGTTALLVKNATPSVLAKLRLKNYTAREFAILSAVDPYTLPATLAVRESSIRTRPHEAKRQDLDRAIQTGVIDAAEARAALASDYLDTPVTAMDRQMNSEAVRAAEEVAAGKEWEPRPLGKHSDFFIQAFVRMMFDSRVRGNPDASARLANAVKLQRQAAIEDQINSDPKLYIERQIAQQKAQEQEQDAREQEAQQQAEIEQQAAEASRPVSLADVVDQFVPKAGGGGGSPPASTAVRVAGNDITPQLNLPSRQAA